MKRRIYFSLVISAIAGLVALVAGVPQGHSNQDRGSQTVPEAWRGMWKVTVDYRDHETGALVATDVSTAQMCPGEPIIPPQLNGVVRCSTAAADSEIGMSCQRFQRMIRNAGCNVFVEAELDSQRDGDTWTGTGSWFVNFVGKCDQTNFGEDVVVSGTRMSNEAACAGEQSSLVQGFFAHPLLVPIFAEGSSHEGK